MEIFHRQKQTHVRARGYAHTHSWTRDWYMKRRNRGGGSDHSRHSSNGLEEDGAIQNLVLGENAHVEAADSVESEPASMYCESQTIIKRSKINTLYVIRMLLQNRTKRLLRTYHVAYTATRLRSLIVARATLSTVLVGWTWVCCTPLTSSVLQMAWGRGESL
jgi:hypothetical protein